MLCGGGWVGGSGSVVCGRVSGLRGLAGWSGWVRGGAWWLGRAVR